jgi:hypothetical protein
MVLELADLLMPMGLHTHLLLILGLKIVEPR